MGYNSAIFDLDGTILQSSSRDLSWLHCAVEQALDSKGINKNFSNSELEVLAGLKSREKFVQKCNSLDLEPQDFWNSVSERRAVNKIEFIKRDNLELRSGAKTLLKSLNENEIKIGLITNSPDSSVDLIIRHFELDQHIDFYRGVTGLEDLGKEKPDPWHIEIAKSEIDRPPFVYLGDSDEDVKAAENATIDSIKLGGNQDLNELKDRLV